MKMNVFQASETVLKGKIEIKLTSHWSRADFLLHL